MTNRTNDSKMLFYLGVGTGAALTLFATASLLTLNVSSESLYSFLAEWQTLTGALIALGAAIATIFVVNRQIQLENQRATDQIDREQFAAKTALPAGLVGLGDYANSALQFLCLMKPLFNEDDIFEFASHYDDLNAPNMPTEAIRLLEAAIRSAGGSNREALAWVLRRLQIVDSRLQSTALRGRQRELIVKHNWLTLVTDFLEFKSRADKLFRYARNETATIDGSISTQDLYSSALVCGVHVEHIQGLERVMLERVANPS